MRVIVVATTRMEASLSDILGRETAEAAEAAGQDVGSDGARLIELAGRTCYDSFGRGRPSADYHTNILAVGHGSVAEHVSISFLISGVSRGLTHELVRHRVGCSVSQRSTRYVDESESPWAWHPLIPADVPALRSFTDAARSIYNSLYADLFQALTARGISPATARKQARGAARGALGNALETELIWTANVRALRHFIEMRATEFADGEIRLLANQLFEKALQIVPEFFSDYERYDHPDMAGIGYGLRTPHRKV